MKQKKRYLPWIVAFCAVALCLLCMGKMGLSYLNSLVFSERRTQLQEVVQQYFDKISLVTDQSWKSARDLAERFEMQEITDVAGVMSFFEKESNLAHLDEEGFQPIAVREGGQYIDADGLHGLLADTEPLTTCTERTSFIVEQPFTGKLFNLYLYRLAEPIRVADGKNTYSIAFVGVSREMESMNQYFKCSAYGGDNSTYILDRYGSKQYVDRSDSMNLIEGHNVYTVLDKESSAQGKDFNKVLDELNQNGVAYSDIRIADEQCFYALYKMQDTDYTLLYINPASRVALSTMSLVNLVIKAFIVIMVSVSGIIILFSFFIIRQNQKQLVRETQSKQQMVELNRKLDKANDELKKSMDATQAAFEAAEAASKAKTDFLSNMSHDIRTPMNAIIGLTTLMENEPNLSEKMHDYLTKLETSGQHLLELINNVLDMNRIESGKTTLNVTSVNLAEQITQVETIIGAQATQRNQRFDIVTTHLSHEYIIADPARLQQVLINILSNAVKYTPRGGHILFEIEELPRDEHYAKYKFIVQDNGIGMSEEFLQHIFDPFSRMESSVTNQIQGTGLGMAITKSVVDLMGGVIHVDSTLGKGSRFEVALEFPIDAKADRSMEHLSLLLVHCENDADYHRVQDAVAGKPIHLCRTRTLEEGFVALRQASYDVVLMPLCTEEANVTEIRELAGPNAILLGAADGQISNGVPAKEMDGTLTHPFFLSNLEAEVSRVHEVRKTAAAEQDVSPLQGMNFLCAEDNEINAEILQMLLETKGATCTVYHNGQEIVDAFENVKPGDYDMILMDVQMPVMDGLEATRRIRSGKNPLGKTIPILAMTANAFLEDRQQSRDAGMDEHLSKPVDIKVLEQTVRRFRLTPPRKNN